MNLVYASIHSADQNAAALAACNGKECWIGFHDATNEGQFEWYDGSVSDYSNWSWGEPNDWGWNGEDCNYTFFFYKHFVHTTTVHSRINRRITKDSVKRNYCTN